MAPPLPPATPAPWASAAAPPVPMPSEEHLDGAPDGPGQADEAGAAAPRRIQSVADVRRFLASDCAADVQAFVAAVASACNGVPMAERKREFAERRAQARASQHQSERDTSVLAVGAVVDELQRLQELADAHPPNPNADRRFGNPVYRQWHDGMAAAAVDAVTRVLPPEHRAKAEELALYWRGAFGDRTRMDYGTGHELSFAALLYCLSKLDVVRSTEAADVALVAFDAYLALTRHLQVAYNLEPAGSHGCWGLDDFAFLPFLFGAGQLMGGVGEAHDITVKAVVVDDRVAAMPSGEWLYVDAVQYVMRVKTGGRLTETSPMLCDIAHGVTGWDKVFSGMKKMWAAEVLGKVPIMQHFVFGTMVPFV